MNEQRNRHERTRFMRTHTLTPYFHANIGRRTRTQIDFSLTNSTAEAKSKQHLWCWNIFASVEFGPCQMTVDTILDNFYFRSTFSHWQFSVCSSRYLQQIKDKSQLFSFQVVYYFVHLNFSFSFAPSFRWNVCCCSHCILFLALADKMKCKFV